ncbi:MAG: hypothetical protein L3J71_16430 [Victivallaceae bacterium]|nr:hypothetical protein [Victivallaceae bacterium]
MILSKFKRLKKINSEYRVIEEMDKGKTTKYEYFENRSTDGKYYGKLKRITYPDSSQKEYTYFPDGIIKSVKKI